MSFKKIFHKTRRILAKNWLRSQPWVRQVAITGSFGKTNTTRAIWQVLRGAGRGVMTDLNLDTIYNIPITALRVRPWHRFVIFELGVDKPGEMLFHLEVVRPKIGVVTGITPVHSDEEHLGSLEGIIREKGHLLEALPKEGKAILNFDDKNVREMSGRTQASLIWYGQDKKNCHFFPEKIKVSLKGLSFILNTPAGRINVKTPLLGRHHIYTCMAASAVGLELGLRLRQIAKGLEKLRPLKGRLSFEKGPKGTWLLDDRLRANPASTIAGLEFLKDIKERRRKIAVLGEMGELGKYKVAGHQEVGKKAAECGLDYLLCVGPLQKHTAQTAIKAGMKKAQVLWVKDVKEAAQVLEKILQKDDIWYLKGSLLRHMERIIYLLEGKKVDCQQVSCSRYQPCSSCPQLLE